MDAASPGGPLAATASGDYLMRWFDSDFVDATGDVVTRTRTQLYVRRKAGD